MSDDAPNPGPILPARLEARLRPVEPAFGAWTRRLVYACVVVVATLAVPFAATRGGLIGVLPLEGWAAIGALLGVVGALYLARSFRVSPRVAPLVLERTRLVLPLSHVTDRTETVALEEVQSVDVIDRGRRPRLTIGTRRGLYVYPLGAFEPPKAAVDFARAVIVAIATRPGGHEQLEDMQRRAQVTLRFVRQQPRVTRAMLGLIAVGFFVQDLTGAFEGSILDQQVAMLRLGANASVLVAEGEWWRLFVSNFLHGGWVHIGFNGLALLSLGSVLERLIGSHRFLLVYLASAVGGTLASAWAAQGPFSVGASTAIFGLLGAFAVMSWRFGPQLPAGIRQSRRWWIFILGINGALPLLLPVIDMAAHAGGFIAGAVVVFLAYPSLRQFDPGAPPTLGIRAGAIALSAVFLFAGLEGVRHGMQPVEDPLALVEHVSPEDLPPDAQNLVAWSVVTATPAPSRALLEAARRRAQRAVDVVGPDGGHLSSFLDTLATAEHRLGHRARALEIERRAIARFAEEGEDNLVPNLTDDRIFWSQLARFAKAEPTPYVQGEVAAEEVNLSFESGAALVERPAGRPLVVFAQLQGPSGPVGVVRLGLAADTPSPASLEAPPELEAALASKPSLQLLWIDSRPEGPSKRELGVAYRPHDPEVDALP